MHIHFDYHLEKDAENFLKGTKSVNRKEPTEFQRHYIAQYGDSFEAEPVKRFIEAYLAQEKTDVRQTVAAIEKGWRVFEQEFVHRAENIFGRYDADITAYLTTNQRCTYSISDGYFFVYLHGRHPNATIMHELWHFYTWNALHDDLEKRGVSPQLYNDIKESLTELLNIECADLLGGHIDKGYPQHAEMRKEVHRLWTQDKNIASLVSGLLPSPT